MTRIHTPPPADIVLGHLKNGRSVTEAAQATGWPVTAIRGLVGRQRGWLLLPNGHVRIYEPRRIPPEDSELVTAMIMRRAHRGISWKQVATEMGLNVKTLQAIKGGEASPADETRVRIEAWLAEPFAPAPAESVIDLISALEIRKRQREQLWRQVEAEMGVTTNELRAFRRGYGTNEVRRRVQEWLTQTALPADSDRTAVAS